MITLRKGLAGINGLMWRKLLTTYLHSEVGCL
jgi:hypothetical protein